MFTTDFEKLKGIKRRPLYRKHEVLSNENEDFGVYEIISKQWQFNTNSFLTQIKIYVYANEK